MSQDIEDDDGDLDDEVIDDVASKVDDEGHTGEGVDVFELDDQI